MKMDIERLGSVGIQDIPIFRHFKCYDDNEECGMEFAQECTVGDKYPDNCPNCKGPVYLDKASLCLSTFIDTKKAKTLGAISEQNRNRMVKDGDPRIDKDKSKKPWFRPSDKIDMTILREPKKYIETGQK